MKVSIKAARVNSGMTLSQAAEKIGVDRMTICNWENGKTTPSVLNLNKLVEAYNCTVDDIEFNFF